MLDSETLETLWQRHPRRWCEHRNFTMTEKGVTLGADTLVAPIVKDAYGRTTLAIDGHEERILTLLSVAHDKPVSPRVLENFRDASRALAKGDESLALICLAHTGLFALHGWNYERNADGAAKALFMADRLLEDGADAGALLKGLGLLPERLSPTDWRTLVKYNQNHVPAGCPEGGQFCSSDEAGSDTTSNDQQIASGAPNDTDQVTTPADRSSGQGKVVQLPDGQTIPDSYSPTGVLMSPTSDLSNVAAAGRQTGATFSMLLNSGSDAASGAAVYLATQLGTNLGFAGTFDYQRDGNMITGYTHYPQFRDVSNVNVGLFCQQAGLSLDETQTVAGAFAGIFSNNADADQPYGLNTRTAQFIVVGYHLGESGVFGKGTKK